MDSSIFDGTTWRLRQNADLRDGTWWWLSPSAYDAAGNEHLMTRYRHGVFCQVGNDVLCQQWQDFYYQESIARYYAADNRLRVTDRRTATSAASTMAGGLEEFRYDALGRRVWRRFRADGVTVGSTVVYPDEAVRFVWDGDEILYEIRAPGSSIENDNAAERLYGRALYTHGPALDRPLYVERADAYGSWLYLHPDWQGRIVAGTWPGGTNDDETLGGAQLVNWRARRTSSYGERQSKFREADPALSHTWMGSFLDLQRDNTEQVYLRNRYYDPVSGRFTQEDPIGLAGGLNLYGFANGDPVTFSDPFGLCVPVNVCLAAAGGLIWGGGQVARNLLNDRPWHEGVAVEMVKGMVIGATLGLVAPLTASAGSAGAGSSSAASIAQGVARATGGVVSALSRSDGFKVTVSGAGREIVARIKEGGDFRVAIAGLGALTRSGAISADRNLTHLTGATVDEVTRLVQTASELVRARTQ